MAREYFCAYYSYLESMSALTDDEKGRLFSACLVYASTGEQVPLSGNERFLFPTFKSQIDRDQKQYDEVCRKRAENIRKRWHPDNTSEYKCIQSHTNDTKTKEKEKEKEKKKDIIIKKQAKTKTGTKDKVEDELETAIGYFKEHRKTMRKPMTEHAVDLLRKKLEDLAPGDTKRKIFLIDYAISKGWQGVYLPTEEKSGASQSNGSNPRVFKFDEKGELV